MALTPLAPLSLYGRGGSRAERQVWTPPLPLRERGQGGEGQAQPMLNWLIQSTTDLPALPAEAWLSPPEQARLATLQVAKRRREWLLGRWTAKRLVQAHLVAAGLREPALAALEITPAPDGSPQLGAVAQADDPVLGAALRTLRLTISHSGERAFCALAPAQTLIGADIENVAPHSAAFVGDYFTPDEQALVAAAPPVLRDTLVTALWSAKEAVLKALRLGLTVDTRLVECRVSPPATGDGSEHWMPVLARCNPALAAPTSMYCWWRRLDTAVLTLAAAPA